MHFARFGTNCPTCGLSIDVSDKENFKRLWKLVHDKPPGPHTPEALYRLGYRYVLGKGVLKNEKEAWSWFERAAEQGHPGAQTELGTMVRDGQYTGKKKLPKNFEEMYYRKAAEQGYGAAQCRLALLYLGRNLWAKATKWFQMAAEQGSRLAKDELVTLQDCTIGQRTNDCPLIPSPPLGAIVTTVLLTSAVRCCVFRQK